ncbi:LodA/GoxA family CTQ-dependent oxidase [Sorangium sp. So ce388]|uniref:LodA/GoxA family CTQ-dependent oxidase n=1 Tax=Sorangium sp. So ce388 TaxID=3133309 RepID=UPI003F5C63CC
MMDTSLIAYCRIYPGLGVARVGNSPDAFFIGPENPGAPAAVPGGYKDAQGRVKRQAARFRVYAYDAEGRALGELTAAHATITWRVELANKKASFTYFAGKYKDPEKGERNPDVKGEDRAGLEIRPGPREITGKSVRGAAHRFDTGTFRYPLGQGTYETRNVPLGELQTDAEGRLLVLGGFGKSASALPDNPVGNPATTRTGQPPNNYANNVGWYDDTSDGPVSATVVAGNRRIEVRGDAHVIVAPPDFAPDLTNIVTLHDVAREVWSPAPPAEVSFHRDVLPILQRIAALRWVNANALRGHGPGRRGDFLDPKVEEQLASPGAGSAPLRQEVFKRIRAPAGVPSHPEDRPAGALSASGDVALFATGQADAAPALARVKTPLATGEQAQAQAYAQFMPILAGDGGDPEQGKPETWMTLLPGQYEILRRWADGDFTPGERQAPRARLESYPVHEQPEALDRAALERCVGAPFYPGIEMTYIAADLRSWGERFRLSPSFGPGDVTKYMALPWQADFYDCNTHWWPAQRPDDVATEAEFEHISARVGDNDTPGTLLELLDGRVRWDRGLRPNAEEKEDESQGEGRSKDKEQPDYVGDNDMVELWHQLGFVVRKQGRNGDEVFVETERAPFVGRNVAENHRAWFNILLNIEQNQDFLPKARELALDFLAQAEALQRSPGCLSFHLPFRYSKEALAARLEAIYDEHVDNGASYDPTTDELIQSYEDMLDRLYQFAPFNQIDGAWLRNVTRAGPIDEVHALLFSIWSDEVGNGDPAKNHCNIYTSLLQSVGFYLPPVESEAYAQNPKMLDSAYTAGVFQLAISQFSEDFLPEILGMTLQLEWEAPSLVMTRKQLRSYGIDPHFYELHIAIDNAVSGHGGQARTAVELHLDNVRVQGGEEAVQETWRRIWNGYVAFATTGTLYQDIQEKIETRRRKTRLKSLEEQVVAIIEQKRPYANRNHGTKRLGPNLMNDWFDDPEGLLGELRRSGMIVDGAPELSPFFQLTSFEGPMYKVFTDEQIEVWKDWTRALGGEERPVEKYDVGLAMARLLDTFRERQVGAGGHGVLLADRDAKPGECPVKSLSSWFERPRFPAKEPHEEQRRERNEQLPGRLPEKPEEVDTSTLTLMRVLADPGNGWVVPWSAGRSALVMQMLSGNGPMSRAFQAMSPDRKDRSYRDVVVTWINRGCPMPGEALVQLEGAPPEEAVPLAAAAGVPLAAAAHELRAAAADTPRRAAAAGELRAAAADTPRRAAAAGELRAAAADTPRPATAEARVTREAKVGRRVRGKGFLH